MFLHHARCAAACADAIGGAAAFAKGDRSRPQRLEICVVERGLHRFEHDAFFESHVLLQHAPQRVQVRQIVRRGADGGDFMLQRRMLGEDGLDMLVELHAAAVQERQQHVFFFLDVQAAVGVPERQEIATHVPGAARAMVAVFAPPNVSALQQKKLMIAGEILQRRVSLHDKVEIIRKLHERNHGILAEDPGCRDFACICG